MIKMDTLVNVAENQKKKSSDSAVLSQFNMAVILKRDQLEDLKAGEIYRYDVNNKIYYVVDGSFTKIAYGPDYNFIFDKRNGDFKRWGTSFEDDPLFSPIGPEILDLEISVNGCPAGCNFCYKNNTNEPAQNMPFETFKHIMDNMPKCLTQIAFGITGIQTHPDFLKMMHYCREIGIIPNFTLSGIDLTNEMAEKCAKVIGALAVSAYQTDKNVCYDAVKKFVDLGIKQTNIHLMVSQETLPFVYEVLEDRQNDPRLQDMSSIVFLGVKPKGRATDGFHSLSVEEYDKLIQYCFERDLSIGFDSCSAPKFEAAVKGMNIEEKRKKALIECSESCESSLFSSYINFKGEYWHCSFSEEESGQTFVDVTSTKNFLKDVWYSKSVCTFRNKSLESMVDGCRFCNVFPSINP